MGIIKEADETAAGIVEFLFVAYLIGWALFGFFGGLQTIWYIGNHRLLKRRKYTEWFQGYKWMYYFIVAVSIIFFIGFLVVGAIYGGVFGADHPYLYSIAIAYGSFYFLITLLGIWYPYAMVESFFHDRHRVL